MEIELLNFDLEKDFIPKRAYSNDAGLDVCSPIDIDIQPGCVENIGLRFGLKIPDGHMGLVFPRSSLAARGLLAQLPPIDSRYRGEIHAVLYNYTNKVVSIEAGDRIGQLVILPVIIPTLVNFIRERNSNGFGSSGK